MNLRWKLGEPFGIGVYVHWTFAILLLLLAMSGGLPGMSFMVDLLFYAAVFGCVILHELGHSLAARNYGIGTRDITLYPIGGVARLDRMPSRPAEELVVALAGPAVNVVIAVLLFPVTVFGGSIAEFFFYLMAANLLLVVFNMLPAFPMDGGRVLRALLAMRKGMVSATNTAATVGKVMAVLFCIAAPFWSPMLLLIAIFVWFQGESERLRVLEAARAEREEFGPSPWGGFFGNSWGRPSGTPPSYGQRVEGAPDWEVLPPEDGHPAGKARFRYYRVSR